MDSIKAISSSVRLYLAYNSASVQGLEKSCIGTNEKTSFDRFIELIESRIKKRTKRVFKYVRTFSAVSFS